MKVAWDSIERDRVFFKRASDIKDLWRDGLGNEVGGYMESLGHWYRLEETRVEDLGGEFVLACLFRYKGKQAEPGQEPQPKGSDLSEFVKGMGLRELAPDSWGTIRIAGPTLVYPI